MIRVPVWCRPVPMLLWLVGCGGSSPSPTATSAPTSFLTGTRSGTLTIQVNPGDPIVPLPTSGTTRWTFEVMPGRVCHRLTERLKSGTPSDDVDLRTSYGEAGLDPRATVRARSG